MASGKSWLAAPQAWVLEMAGICGTVFSPLRSLQSGNSAVCRFPRVGISACLVDNVHLNQTREWNHKLQGVESRNKYTIVRLIKDCGSTGDLEQANRLYSHIVKHGYEDDLYVGNTLVNMYFKCGSSVAAQDVFDNMPRRDVVSWTAIIAGYVQQEQAGKALELYGQMQEDGIRPNDRTFVSLIKACASLAARETGMLVDGHFVKVDILQRGKFIHAQAADMGYASDLFVSNTLVDMYSKCGSIMNARAVFDALSPRSVVAWTAMMAGYAQHEQGDVALQLYSQMQKEGVRPQARCFVSLLKACASLASGEQRTIVDGRDMKAGSLGMGKLLHRDIIRMGFQLDAFVGTSLIHMYAKCGSMMDAQYVFDTLPQCNVAAWNAMIAGYVMQNLGEEALHIFSQMQQCKVIPDEWTFVSSLKACGLVAGEEKETLIDYHLLKVDALQTGKWIHAEALTTGCCSDMFVGNTLVHMYATCGSIADARHVFDSLSHRNLVSWNAMLAGYAEQDQYEKAVQLYAQMQHSGVRPDEATFLSILKVCCSTGALKMCFGIHQAVAETGLQASLRLANTLVHAYGKCGSMVDARRLFDSIPEHNVVSWTALIAGYARGGDCEMALQCLEEMQLAGNQPDSVTFVSLLSACSHAGMVDKGVELFERMGKEFGIPATPEHYVSIVDLLGRAGLLCGAKEMIRKMPMRPDRRIWLSLLGACRKHGNVELARRAFDEAVSLDAKHCAAYGLMSSIYAYAQRWDDVNDIEQRRARAGAWKQPGQSWVELAEEMHMFLVGDESHSQGSQVYAMVDMLTSQVHNMDLSDVILAPDSGQDDRIRISTRQSAELQTQKRID